MKIETKFNIGDLLWIMKDNKPEKIGVEYIRVLCERPPLGDYQHTIETYVSYKAYGSNEYHSEDQVYPSKQALLNSL